MKLPSNARWQFAQISSIKMGIEVIVSIGNKYRKIVLIVAVIGISAALGLSNDLLADGDKPSQTEIRLWPNGAPGALGNEVRDRPTITLHTPPAAKRNGCTVIVCPGGGYGGLASSYEGHEVADWFNTFGVTAFVLRYRHAPHYRHPTPLGDVQRAIRTIRTRSSEWGVDANRIGVMGFSAGGHLASTAGTHFDQGNHAADDPVERQGCRPDFLILAYPVITLTTKFTHKGSLRNLLGENPDKSLVEHLSSEKQVTKETPPTFLFHTNDDQAVPAENSVLFYLALKRSGVPAEMHIYEPGRHGVGLAQKHPTLSSWPGRLRNWMQTRKILTKEKRLR